MGEILYLPNVGTKKSSMANILHDMASPLSALEAAMRKINNLDAKDKKMIKLATTRLRELLDKNRNSPLENLEKISKFAIKETLYDSIYEKEYEHKIKIGCLLLQNLDSIYVNGEESEFKRILSNLINNSFEALINSDIKKINIIVSIRANFINIDISDNGIGLTDEQIRNILIDQKSYKHKGPGLGVEHAKSTVESWGGGFFMRSNKTVGTTITITLPIIRNLKVL